MGEFDGGGEGQERPRPEIVSESVVIVGDSGAMAKRSWGLLVAVGVVALVFGIVVLANIWGSIHLVAIFAGLFLLFAGVLQLVTGARGKGRGGRVVAALLAIIAGIVLIAWPEASVKTVAILVGVSFLVWGLAVAVAALTSGGEGRGVMAGFGALLAVVGVVFIAWPGPTVTLLMILVGLSAVLFGISAIAQGVALRKA